MSISPPISEIQHFHNLTLKIQGQGHSSRSQSRYNTLSTHVPFIPCWSALQFLGYSYFKIWHWKFKVKVMGEVKVESHNMGPTFSRLTSISMSIGHPIPELWLFQNLTLKIKRQGHGWGYSSSHNVGLTSYWLTSLLFHVNRPSRSWDTAFSKFDLENPGSRSNDHDVTQLQV